MRIRGVAADGKGNSAPRASITDALHRVELGAAAGAIDVPHVSVIVFAKDPREAALIRDSANVNHSVGERTSIFVIFDREALRPDVEGAIRSARRPCNKASPSANRRWQ